MVRVSGSNRNDVFYVNAYWLPILQVRAGYGYDTLRVTGSGSLSVSSFTTSQWRELEALNLSAFNGQIALDVSPSLLASSNTRALDITVGETSALTLSASTSGVVLRGNGDVQLSNASNNIVKIASADVTVTGGNLVDTITASAFGNELDGRSGNDVLTGGTGADTFVHGAASGHDTFNGFNVATDHIELAGTGVASWHDLQQLIEDTPAGAKISFEDGSSITLNGVTKSDLSQDDFTVGGETLPLYDQTIVIAPGTSAQELNAIIAAAPDGATIILAAGTHAFDATIVINRSHITLTGEGEGLTRLVFAEGASLVDGLIKVGEVAKTYVTVTADAAAANAESLALQSTEGLAVGYTIYLYQPNTADYLAANGWTNVSLADAAERPFREYITTITAIDGNSITLADPLPYDFAAGETRIFTMDMLQDVALRDFTVATGAADANTYLFENQSAGLEGVSALHVSGTDGVTLQHITIEDAPSIGLTLASSINALVDALTVDGSLNLGGEGNGYGVLLSEAFNNSLSNLSITDVRHALTFSAWNAEAFNDVHIVFANRDINFHGSPDVGNVVEADRVVLDYDISVDPSLWSLISGGGTDHAATDILGGNQVHLRHGEGSSGVDLIVGADGGSYLNGHGSNDVLIGGAGDDVIVGGLRRDVMTGGGGQDVFLFRMGDDLDTVTDMDFGIGGDTLVIMGNPAVDGFSDLVLTQDGADVRVRYGSNSTFILKDTVIADVDPQNFVFDSAGLTFMDEWLGG